MVSEELKREIKANITTLCLGIRPDDEDFDAAFSFLFSEGYLNSQSSYYLSVLQELGINPNGKKVLEIGPGYCSFLVHAYKKLKWDIYGIESGKAEYADRFQLTLRYLAENGVDQSRLRDSFGDPSSPESPFYDIIISNNVLEHVEDLTATVGEAFRALKPGGVMISNVPNYRWFYEGHYNILWLPFLSKSMAKTYVRLRGRDPDYINHLNFLTPRIIKRLVRDIPGAKLCLPLDYKTTEAMIERVLAYVESRRGPVNPLVRILAAIVSLKAFRGFMEGFARLTGCYHQMHIVLRKAPTEPASRPSADVRPRR